MPLTVYRCPKCGHIVSALAGEVWHACPKDRGKTVQYEPQLRELGPTDRAKR